MKAKYMQFRQLFTEDLFASQLSSR